MGTVDILIAGAGVIGLAVAGRLSCPGKQIVFVERHDSFGRETSSRNSEVIHCGMYYAKDILKARLCVGGNPILYELCEHWEIPHRKTGKIVVATDGAEEARLQQLLEQGGNNRVMGLQLITGREVADREPQVSARMGLLSQDSGIVDSHRLSKYLERTAIDRGATIAYRCEVTSVSREASGYLVVIKQADGETLILNLAV